MGTVIDNAGGVLNTGRTLTVARLHTGGKVSPGASGPRFVTHPSGSCATGFAMTSLARRLFVTCLLGLVMTLGAPSASAAPANKAILLLFPYQQDLPIHLLAVQAFREAFANNDDLRLDLYYEFLDLNRFPDRAYQQQLFALLAEKYRNKRIDLVILQQALMLNLWLAHRHRVAPGTPIIFFDVLTDSIARELPPEVTGVSGTVDFTKSIEWFLRARPEVDDIVLVQGAGAIDQEKDNSLPVAAFVQQMRGKVHITDLSGLPLSEITRRVAALPKRSVVLHNVMFEDAAGVRYRPIDVLRELAAAAAVPVITGYDQLIGTGTIGGYMYSVEDQARETAQIGLRILRGEAVRAALVPKELSSHYIFDHLALQRFDIPLSALPPGSIIKNRQYSLWELYRPQILSALTVMTVLLLLIMILLGVTRQLQRTRSALAAFNVTLESQVQERTTLLSRTNSRLQDEIAERKQTAEALQTAQQLLMCREIERSRINEREQLLEDLHDGFGSQLTSARLRVEEGEMDQPQLAELLNECMTDLHLLVDTVKSTDLDLAEAMRNLRNRYQRRLAGRTPELYWDLRLDEAPAMPQRTILIILRIVQEALNNALKHAQARRIDITAHSRRDGQLSVTIRDDGCGLPDHPGYGRGLHTMRSRAKGLGGDIAWRCSPPGTLVELNLPLAAAAQT